MIKKLLIANRGEIACRVIRTAKKMGIRTVAIYSEIDANALHVQMADESYCVGSAASADSYLNGKKIIQVAKAAQVDAIHPGYGFLSEDAEFAQLCQEAGLIFVGPSAEAIRIMGDKNLAKNTMVQAKVPVVPGYDIDAVDIQFPVLVKASAGGGGKGMRVVEKASELAAAAESARREAQASFGDSRIFLEKYLATARHIEVQILFDQYGHGLYLFDRDCSVQRRHQKVIEEAPAPGLTESTRQKMADTALRAGAAIQYCGVGTIEFLVDENANFYFMEMNTRLQVEHPVTEMITGLDLVEWQLRVAGGEKLTLQQQDIKKRGHAIEARLYAENPSNHFMPSAGILRYFQLPSSETPAIRVDSGFQTGDEISVYYDPLLAKLIAWGEDRQKAIRILQSMLQETAVVGIHTNWALLNRLITHPDFITGQPTTHFIADHQTQLLAKSGEMPAYVMTIAGLALLKQQQTEYQPDSQQNSDIFSPWLLADGWRQNGRATPIVSFWEPAHSRWLTIRLNEEENRHAIVFIEDNQISVFCDGEQWSLYLLNPREAEAGGASAEGKLQAPMPGTIVEIYVKPSQTVAAGERLLVMEAMKMEHSLLAPRPGAIRSILCKTGDRVNQGAILIELDGEK
jgi:3-methylcrotonyl-CoA carboxylase alpha subunit